MNKHLADAGVLIDGSTPVRFTSVWQAFVTFAHVRVLGYRATDQDVLLFSAWPAPVSTGLQLDLARNLYEREGDDGPSVHLTLLAESVPADVHAELVGAHVNYLGEAVGLEPDDVAPVIGYLARTNALVRLLAVA